MPLISTNQTTEQTSSEQEIIQLSANKYRWKTEQKIDLVEDLFDDSLVFVHLNGHFSSKKEWIGMMRSKNFVYHKIEVKEVSAKVYGNTAVLVGKAVFTINGGSIYRLAYTEVYTKKNQKWKLVNIHTCGY